MRQNNILSDGGYAGFTVVLKPNLVGKTSFVYERGDYKMKMYCIKCNSRREVKNPEKITLKSGKPAVRGICSVCGSRILRMGSTSTR